MADELIGLVKQQDCEGPSLESADPDSSPRAATSELCGLVEMTSPLHGSSEEGRRTCLPRFGFWIEGIKASKSRVHGRHLIIAAASRVPAGRTALQAGSKNKSHMDVGLQDSGSLHPHQATAQTGLCAACQIPGWRSHCLGPSRCKEVVAHPP